MHISSPSASLIDLGDQELAMRARSDRSAFAELYRRHVQAVHAFTYRRSGSRDVAEEATSATFEKALRSISSFEWRQTGLRPWLYKIASNEVANVYRRSAAVDAPRGQLAMRELAPDANISSSDLDGTVDRFDSEGLHRALDELPARYREAITLRYLSGLSADDAAIAMGCSKPILAVTLHRAVGVLRKRLSEPTMTTGGK
ncbi:MAG: RNA polymerase sigma factor [Ilumatobacteraceae bacterium]